MVSQIKAQHISTCQKGVELTPERERDVSDRGGGIA